MRTCAVLGVLAWLAAAPDAPIGETLAWVLGIWLAGHALRRVMVARR